MLKIMFLAELKSCFGVKFVEPSNMAKVTTSRTTFSRFHNFQIKELSIGELDAVARLSSFQLFHENAFRLLESLKRDETKKFILCPLVGIHRFAN